MKYKTILEQARQQVQKAEGLLAEFEGKELPAEKLTEFDGLMKSADELKGRADRLRLVEERDAELKTLAEGAADDQPLTRESKSFGPVYAMRFGEDSKAQATILADLIGPDYQQQVFDQNAAFAKYLRFGDRGLESAEVKLLRQQWFPWSQVEQMVKNGMDVRQVKTVMVEAQGSLGGYAVPPNVQQAIISRLPGLTAVRGGGATVIDLQNSNSIEITSYTGGTTPYRGALRGVWGAGEAPTPTAKNATLGLETIVAHVYTYKVGMSQSLVEDASNLLELVQRDIGDTLSIDEDTTFLVGDGNGKPLGILPDEANSLSLTHVHSGNGTALTTNGIKLLKRGLGAQYRRNAKWIAESATYGAIDVLSATGTGSDFAFPDLAETGMLLRAAALESEAMPTIGANTFPIIYGDLSGYYIVQRAGLTIERMHDSNTGINKVEFHVRRRVGGRVAEPWKFVVQEVAA